MDELLQEIDRKDELVDYLKIENANLKEDLKNMEDLIKQTKDNISLLGEELEAASDKLKHSECLLQSKDEHIHELLAELEHRNR
jgi:chromosome segregation ATPase